MNLIKFTGEVVFIINGRGMNIRFFQIFLAIALSAECSAGDFRCGEPIPVEKYGQIGSGGLINNAVGTLDSDGKKLLLCYSSGCMMNKNIFHSYLEIGRAEDGAPLFKKSARFDSPECGFNNRTRIFKSRDGNTYAFFATPQGLFRAKVDSISGKFSFFGKLLKCGQFCAIVENPDGSYYIYTSAKTVLKEPEKKEVHPWNGQRYVPFDGSLIWRKGEYRSYLQVQKLDSIDSENLSEPKRATTSTSEVISYTCGDSYSDSSGTVHMFVGTREGVITYYNVKGGGMLSPVKLCKVGDVALRAPLVDNSPVVMLRGGNPDLYAGGEGGIYYYGFDRWMPDGTPVFKRDLRAREVNTRLFFGSLPVVEAVDWDGDGLTDIVIGNSQGQVGWAKNVGSPGNPKFLEPDLFLKNGEEFMEKGGYLNLQGPEEAQWGYVGPAAFDWDEDGILDLLTGDNSSHFGVYFNLAGKGGANFAERKMLYCNGLEVHGTWRQRPGIARMQNGKIAYVILDWDDQARLYWRMDKLNLVDVGKLRLVDGSPITATGTQNGECGRIKFDLADVDGDGKTDILMGTIGCNSVPNLSAGIPRNLAGSMMAASVLWLRNVGSEDNPIFEYPRLMMLKTSLEGDSCGESVPTKFGWHSCSVSKADFGGDLQGLLVGMEDGNIYFYKFSQIDWRDFNSLERKKAKNKKNG